MIHYARTAFLSLSLVFFTGCGGGIAELATRVLYPFDQVDKKYPVPENPPDDLKQITFESPSTDGSTLAIHAWHYRAANPNARVFVYFHGNGENLQAMHSYNFFGALKSLNVHFIVIDYPGLGRSTGEPNQENLVNAALKAVDWARETYKNSTLVIWGRSLGAGVATQAAHRRQDVVDGLVLTSPWNKFLDAARALSKIADSIPKDWLAKNAYDSAAAAADIRLRTLIHHGTVDKLIPIALGRTLAAAFPEKSQVTFKEIEGKEHNDIFTADVLWQDVRNFLR